MTDDDERAATERAGSDAPAAVPRGNPNRARNDAVLIGVVAIALMVALVAAAPTAETGDPTADVVSQVLLVFAVALGALVVVRRFSLAATGWLLAIATGLFLAGGAAVLLNANAFGPLGATLDQSFRTAQITRFAHEWGLHDFSYRGRPAYYPPLYFWGLGRVAALVGAPAWHMVKVGLLVVALVVPLATFALWRRVVSVGGATVVAVLASLVFQDWYAPYLWIAIVVFVPWWLHWGLGVGRDPQARWSTPDLAVGIALGAVVLLTYWFLLVVAAVHLLGLVIARAVAPEHATRLLPPSRRGPALVLGGTLLVTAVYWLPFAIGFATTRGAQMMQNRYFTPDEITLPTPFLTFDLRGIVLLGGLLYLLAAAVRRPVCMHLVGVLAAAYVLCIVGFAGFLADTPIRTERTQGVIEYTLAAGAALGVEALWHAVRRRPVRERVDLRTATFVAVAIALVGVFAFGQTAVRAIPYLDEQRAAEYPKRLLADFERATRGRSSDAVVLTDVTDLNTFLPVYVFNASDAHYSHPAGLFNDRAELLTRLARERDPEVFALALLHNRYDDIDYVALRPNAGGLGYAWVADAFPRGVEDRSVTFPLTSFSSAAFELRPSSKLTVFRVNRAKDPLRRLRRCPTSPGRPECAVLRPLLARYATHLDDETRALARAWERRR